MQNFESKLFPASYEQEGLGLMKGKKEPLVQLQRLPRELDQAVHQTLTRRSDPGTSATRTATTTEGPSELEAMEVEAPPEHASPLWPPRPAS